MLFEHTPTDIALAISAGHSFADHVERGEFGASVRHGADLGISTQTQFAEHILATMMSTETVCFRTEHGHDIYYNHSTNTMIIYDPQAKDLGTCFRPTGHEKKFEREFRKDVQHGGRDNSHRIRRGYGELQTHCRREAFERLRPQRDRGMRLERTRIR